jgi:glycosyltransferase involved in cell wall biosynthesis
MIGAVGYCQNTGLGVMLQELRKHCGVTTQLAIAHSGFDAPFDFELATNCHLNGAPSDGNPFDFTRYKWEVQREDLEAWVATHGVKTAVFIETPFGKNTFRWCKELGLKTALIVMPEWFDYRQDTYKGVDLYICPTFSSYQSLPLDNRRYMPWPVDTEALKFRLRAGKAKTFVHNAGNIGLNGRKGTKEAVHAFAMAAQANSEIRLLVRAQRALPPDLAEYISRCNANFDDRIVLDVRSRATVAELYEEGDVLIQAPLYEGHALTALEGMAAGFPVITTDAEPMNEYSQLGDPLLVPVRERMPAGTINPAYEITLPDVGQMAKAIIYCAENDMSEFSDRNRRFVEEEYSWGHLGDRWRDVLSSIESR